MRKFLPFMLSLGLIITSLSIDAQLSIRIIKTGTEAGVDVSYDDGEFENSDIDKLYDDDLDMGWEGEDLNIMTTFLRFQNVQIPQGTQIDSAFLLIYAHEDEADEARITCFAHAHDNSPAFVDTEVITDRTWTTDSVKWVINTNWTMWQPYRSIDLKNIIQAVVSRPGWVAGNSLTIFLRGEDQGASLLDNARDFESFENIEDPADGGDGLHHPERIPQLIVYGGTLGLNNNTSAVKPISVYPNPSNNGFVYVDLTSVKNANIQVYNVAGQLVKEVSATSNTNRIDLSEMQNGVYFVKVITENETFSSKVIINK